MGGKVFSSGDDPLHTPRMAPAIYEHVQKQCISALKSLFPRVESPIEGPEKASFGDIDILVSLEGTDFPAAAPANSTVWSLIQEALGGVRSHYEARKGAGHNRIVDSMSIAIPWPTDLSADERAAQTLLEAGQPAAGAGETGEDEGASKARYIQVDVRLCESNRELDWRRFKHNHGDLWNMLGQTIRPFGLTADEASLYIRIPEIERENKKGARVFLTSNPTEVLDFLGLSHQNGEWERPFRSVEELFEYAASCRWFMLWPKCAEDEEDEEEEEEAAAEEKTVSHDNCAGAGTKRRKDRGSSEDVKRLKHNDRARMKQRPAFARWVEEFIPQCRAQGRFLVADPRKTPDDVRDDVRRLAFNTFPGCEAAYAATLAAWRREKARIYVKSRIIKEDMCLPADISHALPPSPSPPPPPQEDAAGAPGIERNWRGVLRSALARILIDDDAGFGGIEPPRLRDGQGVLIVEDVKDWIIRNWEAVGRAAWEVQCARARAGIEERRRKLAEAGGAAGEGGEDGA